MAKGSGAVRGQAKRAGLSFSRLSGGGDRFGNKYAIRGGGGRTNMRAKTLREASKLISGSARNTRQANAAQARRVSEIRARQAARG